ncbi:MAG: hypothetical protein QM715_08205 [Nibricoccus sp.]
MITRYDYLNIAVYFAFVLAIGLYFSRRSKNTSDYFRGGGALPWWITGAGAWMAGFSAWTFTGTAAEIYQTGPYALIIFYANLTALFAILFFTCYRLRRMRVVTPFEAVRLRFGPATQQFYTWIRLPVAVILASMMLNTVGVFMAGAFGSDLTSTIVVLGFTVTFVSLLGGSFAVAASDFVQMLIVVTVTLIVSVLALAHPSIGGVSGLVAKVPTAHLNWSEFARPELIAFWFFALTLNNLFVQNSLSDDRTAKFMMARSDRHARLMLAIPIAGTIITPLLWVIPPMAAAVLHPNIGAYFPNLKYPAEGAFLLTAHTVLPQGMLGLLICGIFAATLTHADTILNQGAGMLIRNFYLPVVDPYCSEKKLLRLSKFATAIFGVLIILLAVYVSKQRTTGLFHLLNQLGIALMLPLAIPTCLGMFYKRTPSWSAWSTVVIGFSFAAFATFVLKPEMLDWIPGFKGPFTPKELNQFANIATVTLVGTSCVIWFFFTSLFYDRSSAVHKANVEEFFERLRTPLLEPKEEAAEDLVFPTSVGRFCLLYGGIITLFAAIPNSLSGRLCFVACGGMILTVGVLLTLRYKRKAALSAKPATPTTANKFTK